MPIKTRSIPNPVFTVNLSLFIAIPETVVKTKVRQFTTGPATEISKNKNVA